MTNPWTTKFLGTSSGGGPSESRNCSSLVTDVAGDGSLWMVDCAEGTNRQFAMQPYGQRDLKASKLTTIFITHMHADHTMGIVPILRNILFPPRGEDSPEVLRPPRIEIYGPAGLRHFVRTIMQLTFTKTSDSYVVHELLSAEDKITPCIPIPAVLEPLSSTGLMDPTGESETRNTSDILQPTPFGIMHVSESPGRDIRCGPDGFWRGFTSAPYRRHPNAAIDPTEEPSVLVDAGSIQHRDPCIGYVFKETRAPHRKMVILGDTFDPSAMQPLITSPTGLDSHPTTLLIHEATDAFIPRSIDPSAKRTPEVVLEKALSYGHSTPGMAGAFAKAIGAQKLVLNHIGARFPAPRNNRGIGELRTAVMREIERQASEAWGGGRAQAAIDFMKVVIPGALQSTIDEDVLLYDDVPRSSNTQENNVVHDSLWNPGKPTNVGSWNQGVDNWSQPESSQRRGGRGGCGRGNRGRGQASGSHGGSSRGGPPSASSGKKRPGQEDRTRGNVDNNGDKRQKQ